MDGGSCIKHPTRSSKCVPYPTFHQCMAEQKMSHTKALLLESDLRSLWYGQGKNPVSRAMHLSFFWAMPQITMGMKEGYSLKDYKASWR